MRLPTLGELGYLLPEFFLAMLLLCVILLDATLSGRRKPWLVGFGRMGLFGYIYLLYKLEIPAKGFLDEQFSFLPETVYLKLLIAFVTVLWLGYEPISEGTGERMTVWLGALLGSSLLLTSDSLLMIYLSAELISLSLYLGVCLSASSQASRAALNYFLYGAAASAAMLYGISLQYYIGGSLLLNSFAQHALDSLTQIALLFFLAGLVFKSALVPFHAWVSSVYANSSATTGAFLAVVPKIAALGLWLRLSDSLLYKEGIDWQLWLVLLSLAGIVWGNFAALQQQSAKRMLAYSGVAHSGFMIAAMGVLPESRYAILLYAVTYIPPILGAFLLVHRFTAYHPDNYKTFSGLGRRYPIWGILGVIIFVALVGMPPTGNFWAKFFVFTEIWQSYLDTQRQVLLLLFVVGLLNTVVAIFYYLQIPYFMFFKPERGMHQEKADRLEMAFVALMCIFILWIFINPMSVLPQVILP
ncbi:MAG: hypothetical protein JJT94_15000 [Bernardetiaceae bacterium]|nr:hypothetical protein [Bernardetiaceae bacterium]